MYFFFFLPSIIARVVWFQITNEGFDYCLLADYENFYPKEKKEIPKGNDQKSDSKGR